MLRLLSEFHQKKRTALTWWQKLLDLRSRITFWSNCSKKGVIVHPNCRVQKILSQYLTELTEELKRIQRIEQDDDILENIIYLVELIAHMGISWLEVNKWCTDLKMKNIVCGSYHKMSVTAITARFATSVWTAATIRFITQTPRMMKNKGNALTIGFVRAFLVFSENKLRQIRVKRRFW